jgi:hypothetical protein
MRLVEFEADLDFLDLPNSSILKQIWIAVVVLDLLFVDHFREKNYLTNGYPQGLYYHYILTKTNKLRGL